MTDIEVLENTELMVAGISGQTPRGIDFVDTYTATQMEVVDLGGIVIHEAHITDFISLAEEAGLTVAHERQP